jgi:prophage regulatory protein
MERFYRDKDIAEALGVSRNTVWRWTREGRLAPPVKLGPGCSRWRESAVKELTRGQSA